MKDPVSRRNTGKGSSIDSSGWTKRDPAMPEVPGSDWRLPDGRSKPMAAKSPSTVGRLADRSFESCCRCARQRRLNITRTQVSAWGDMYETLGNDLGGAVFRTHVSRNRPGHPSRVSAGTHDARQTGRLQGERAEGQHSAQ